MSNLHAPEHAIAYAPSSDRRAVRELREFRAALQSDGHIFRERYTRSAGESLLWLVRVNPARETI